MVHDGLVVIEIEGEADRLLTDHCAVQQGESDLDGVKRWGWLLGGALSWAHNLLKMIA